MRWLRHAFAVDPPGPLQPTPEQAALADRICREIVRRRLATPVLALLETVRPLNYVGAQALHVLAPIASTLLDGGDCRRFALFLERRGSIDYLCRRIEEMEARPGSGSTAGETAARATPPMRAPPSAHENARS